jgi:3-hydroxyisobutyrate dehydrogenase
MANSSVAPQVAFIGLGNMGEPMVANLRKAGIAVKVFDADTVRAQEVARRHGATACADWAALAAGSAVVITMLPTGAVVRNVLLEAADGLATHLRPGTVVVDMSSSEPLSTRELGLLLQERQLALVDAPVSGGVPGAVAGTLSIMAGARDGADIDKAMPAFEAMGKRVFRTGGPGSGHAMKALNNFVAATAYAATAEAVLIGDKFGLDEALMVEIINTSTGRSFNSEVVFASHVVPRKFATGFAMGLMAKDVGIASQLGVALGVDAPVSRLVSQRWEAARQALGDSCDQSRALLAWGVKP